MCEAPSTWRASVWRRPPLRLHSLVERVDRGTRQPEDIGDALGLQDLDRCLGRRHACHLMVLRSAR